MALKRRNLLGAVDGSRSNCSFDDVSEQLHCLLRWPRRENNNNNNNAHWRTTLIVLLQRLAEE